MSSRKNYECSKESEHENELEQQLRSDIDLFGLSNLLSKLNKIKSNSMGITMNQYMLKHLTRPRTSDKFKGFSYQKTLKDVTDSRNRKHKVIAWDVFYNNSHILTLDTLKEVKYFITKKADQ